MVASDAGLQVVSRTASGLSVGPAKPVCGRPVRLAPLGESTFAVATTIGLAIVSVEQGAVSWKSMSLMFGFLHHEGTLLGLPTDADAIASCQIADSILDGPALAWAQKTTAMVAVTPTRLLAARGHHLFDIDVKVLSTPVVTDALQTNMALDGLRMTESHDRVYGVGRSGFQTRAPVFDLRGTELAVTGQHELTAWVQRVDAGALSARLLSNGSISLARVAR